MKNKVLSIIFVIFIFTFAILNILMKDIDISYSERRRLAKFPKITLNNLFNGDFVDKFESYTLDQFPFRDKFRSIKSNIELNIFRKKDSNNYYVFNDAIYKLEYKVNKDKIESFNNKMNNLYNNYLKDLNVYYTIIPDKGYYLDSTLKLDYDYIFDNVKLDNMKYIDIRNELNLDDYYRTDTHWDQSKLDKVVTKLSKEMDFKYTNKYSINTYSPFKGVYYGGLGLNLKPDTLTYLTNEYTKNAIVKNIEGSSNLVYDIDKLSGIDAYDIFLQGSTPFLEITNPLNTSGKELVIFRDSFGSSITPLLIEGYSKITLVDLRYMFSSSLKDLMEFNNQDVLIMYSTLLINNSDTIRK